MPSRRPKKKCSGYRRDGGKCRAWAKHGERRCAACLKRGGAPRRNLNAATPGSLFSQYATADEQARIPAIIAELDILDSEIVAATILLQRIFQYLTHEWDDSEIGEHNSDTGEEYASGRKQRQQSSDLWALADRSLERLRRLKETRRASILADKMEKMDELIDALESAQVSRG